MKVNKFFMAGLCSIALLTSCSKDDIQGGDDGTRMDAYMTLTLVGEDGNGGSRSQAGQGTENGTPVESKISSAMVLLATATDGIISQVVKNPILVPTSTGATTEAFAVDPGTYYVWVIANPTDEMKTSIATAQKVGDLTITGVTAALMSSQYAADNKFLMFNECNDMDDVQGLQIVVTTSNNTPDKAATGANPIKLDRLAAKIRNVALETGTMDITGVTGQASIITAASVEGFVLLNGIAKANMQQHWAEAKPTSIATTYKKTLITPETTMPTDYYANFTDYATVDGASSSTGVLDKTRDNTYDFTAIHCMENNSLSIPSTGGSAAGDLRGNTTGVIYRANFTVTGSDEAAGADCFYGYQSEYFATLAALGAKYPQAFGVKSTDADGKNTYNTWEDVITGGKIADVANFRAKYQIRVFEKGHVYYTHYIKDQNYQTAEGKNYYSVFRNTIYGLTVTALTGVGDDIPGGWTPDPADPENPDGPDPDEPIDTVKTYMKVTVAVNPWVLSNYDVEL